jgi:hypothetical protein
MVGGILGRGIAARHILMVLVSRGLGHRGRQAVHYAKADGNSGKNVNGNFILFVFSKPALSLFNVHSKDDQECVSFWMKDERADKMRL